MPRTTDAFPVDGGCTCRHVRYRMATAPMFVHCCHCTWCQRETGSAFALNALIEADQVRVLQGEVDVVNTPSNSGRGQRIARCPLIAQSVLVGDEDHREVGVEMVRITHGGSSALGTVAVSAGVARTSTRTTPSAPAAKPAASAAAPAKPAPKTAAPTPSRTIPASAPRAADRFRRCRPG